MTEGPIPAGRWDAARAPVAFVPDTALAFVWIRDWDQPGLSTVDFPTPVPLGQARREAPNGLFVWEPGTQPHDPDARTVRLRPQFAPCAIPKLRRMAVIDVVDPAGAVLERRIVPEESLR